MFIAHLPAGYILTKALLRQGPEERGGRGNVCEERARRSQRFLSTGLFFSIAPDLDLFWFYLGSDRLVPHHQYITHWPLFWLALAAGAGALALVLKKPAWRAYLFVALVNVMLHLALDSVAAEIYWLAPFSFLGLNLAAVPAVHSWWVWNFVLHWTFALELGICLAALSLFIRDRRAASRSFI